MAIASVGKSGGAKGAIGYVLKTDKEKEPIIIGGAFGSKGEITRQFDAYSALRPGVKNQVSHISISLKPGEHLGTSGREGAKLPHKDIFLDLLFPFYIYTLAVLCYFHLQIVNLVNFLTDYFRFYPFSEIILQ
jgi:hypothetical protein